VRSSSLTLAVSTTTNKFTQPALVGGTVLGVLSALPVVAAGNVCCCLWVVSGGAIAAYLLQQGDQAPITTGDGAIAGLFAGVVGAFIYLLLSIPITIFLAPIERMFMERLAEMAGTMQPDFRNYVGGHIGQGIGLIVGFIMMLFFGSAFSALGGVLGAAIFRRSSAVPPGGPGSAGASDIIDLPRQ
jgi:hypothetical protein